jgi:NADPH:quinone reductase
MRAVLVERFGEPDELRIRSCPVPVPRNGELLVAVAAAGVNPVDAHNRRDGRWAGINVPFTPGSDASGVVAAVGDDVDEFAVGDEVFYFSDFLGNRAGSYAEYQVVDAAICARKPATIGHVDAAAVPVAAGTAWELLERPKLERDEQVLIIGAAGGVGGFAVQLAVARGARVTAVARSEHHDYLCELGAAETIDYTRSDPFAARDRFDLVVDLVGEDTLPRALETLRDFGRLATACPITGDFDRALDKNLTLYGILVRPERARLARLAALIEAGSLRVELRRVLGLDNVSEAHRVVETPHGRGRVVLAIAAT